jgi:integrase
VRYLQLTEVRTVLEECPAWLQAIVALAVSTGMRRGEILGLRWMDLDVEHSGLLLRQTKNGEGRIVYLNNMALAAVRSIDFDKEPSPPTYSSPASPVRR